MDKPFPYFHLTTANMILMVCMINMMLNAIALSYLSYSTQIRDIYLQSNNQSITSAQKNTERIMVGVNNSSNITSTLISYLVSNFGENSGYLERENFQYQQANETANAVKELVNILNNQTK